MTAEDIRRREDTSRLYSQKDRQSCGLQRSSPLYGSSSSCSLPGTCWRLCAWNHIGGIHSHGKNGKWTAILPNYHPFMHTFTHQRWSQPCKVTTSWFRAVRVRRLARGHLDTQRGGAGNGNSNLPVSRQPAPTS